jgi:short-subunit dehydrogenase
VITEFGGSTAVITGAGGGIGREIAIRLDSRGVKLALLDLDHTGLTETRSMLTGESRSYVVDVCEVSQMSEVVDRVAEDLSAPNILVNCAGRLGPFTQRIWEYTNDEWRDVFEVNLYGAVNFVRAFLPSVRSGNRQSHIAVIASTAGIMPQHRAGAYAASKHALVSYAETLNLELRAASERIDVTIVCPGAVRTNFNSAVRAIAPNVDPTGPGWLGPENVADQVMTAFERGDLYVFTHEESKSELEGYYHELFASFR